MSLQENIYLAIQTHDQRALEAELHRADKSDVELGFLGKSFLRHAIFYGNLGALEHLCTYMPEWLNHIDRDGYTPLREALLFGTMQSLETLCAHGADTSQHWGGKSPLYWALLYAPENMLAYLLKQQNVDVDDDSQRVLNRLASGMPKAVVMHDELNQ